MLRGHLPRNIQPLGRGLGATPKGSRCPAPLLCQGGDLRCSRPMGVRRRRESLEGCFPVDVAPWRENRWRHSGRDIEAHATPRRPIWPRNPTERRWRSPRSRVNLAPARFLYIADLVPWRPISLGATPSPRPPSVETVPRLAVGSENASCDGLERGHVATRSRADGGTRGPRNGPGLWLDGSMLVLQRAQTASLSLCDVLMPRPNAEPLPRPRSDRLGHRVQPDGADSLGAANKHAADR